MKRGVADSRLLTILAPGGAGKTRLAIQAAADLTGDFPDGVFFVDLAPIAASEEIPQTIFESVGVPIASGDDMRTQLLAYLANKQQLLVTDNFEHVLDGTELISEILNAAPRVKLIATSRVKLGVAGESVLLLSGLEASWETPEEAGQAEAVQLFVEAARRADRGFQLTDSDLEPLSRIIQSVEGNAPRDSPGGRMGGHARHRRHCFRNQEQPRLSGERHRGHSRPTQEYASGLRLLTFDAR